MDKNREHLASRLGFILLSAGCAIGCGNVWKFPWMTGQFGGGGFVLVYIICLLVLGLPVMVMEFAMGRASQASPIGMYQALEMGNSKVLNIIMLGVYVGYKGEIDPAIVWGTIEHKLASKAKLLPLNKQAFEKGLEIGRSQR